MKMKKENIIINECDVNYGENNYRQSRPTQRFIPSGDPNKKGPQKGAEIN